MEKKRETGTAEYELIYEDKLDSGSVILSTPAADLKKSKTYRGGASWSNMLIQGDNLPVLKALLEIKKKGGLKNPDGSSGVKLIYIDPPFSTNLKFRCKKDQRAYEDKIVGAKFLEFLRRRLIIMRELLTDDGSIYVHLDWKKAHYVKVIMDEVFGEENFLNDIIWSYGGRGAKATSSRFSRNHDIILWYRKNSHIFKQSFIEKRIKKGTAGFHVDESGRWFKTSPRGDYTDESIALLTKEGRVYRTKNGNIRIKYFVREDGDWLIEDKLIGDVWDDIPDAMHISNEEKTGYPTQKPEALLYRIIKTSSSPGDIVLDAFSGAGTTITSAEKLGRRWIGIDSGKLAIHTAQKRLLSISRTKDPDNPKKRYGRVCSPFTLYRTEEAGEEIDKDRDIRPECYQDPQGNCVISFSGLKDSILEKLSFVMLDYGFNGEVFRVDGVCLAEELKESKYEIRIPADKIKGRVKLIYYDISGEEISELIGAGR